MKFLQTGVYFIISILIFAACKEDSGTIGMGIMPEDEFLNTDYFDTTTIVAHSALHDSLITSNVSINMLGYLNDPVFGKTQAEFYTQFRLSAYIDESVGFGENPAADSLVLTFVYAGYYGDTLKSFKVNVYELDENMSKNENYYSVSSLKYKGVNLTENPNLYISPRPTTQQDTSASTYSLTIRLDKSLADRFIAQPKSTYASDAAFLNYFKGLFISAEEIPGNDGCMVSLNTTHSSSRLTIHYHNSQTNNLTYSFNLNDSTAHFGSFNHFNNYVGANSNLREQLTGNQTSTKEVLYGQAGAGIKVVLNFPYLRETFNNQKVIIHRAALVISHKDDALANYPPPSTLTMTYTDPETGTSYLLPDYYLGLQNDYFGGTYNQQKKEYSFNITQYIQALADGRADNFPLNLLVSPSVTHFSRLMIYGTHPPLANDFNKRLQLKINYTIVD